MRGSRSLRKPQCCVLGFHTYVFNDLPNGVEQR
jgi:hypothetical protein